MVKSKLFDTSGDVEFADHSSVESARMYCRIKYTGDESVDTWQVIVHDGERLIHYSQPEYEKRGTERLDGARHHA